MEFRKQNRPSFKENAKHYFCDFAERTGIHGLNFIAEKGRSIWEKLWWITIVIIAVYLSIFMIYQTFDKWRSSPVVVSFATQHTGIWQIPFPAISICPEIKSMKSKFNYTDLYVRKEAKLDLTPIETAQFEYMSLLCDPKEDLLNTNFSTFDVAALDFLYEVAPNFTKYVYQATWRGKKHYTRRVPEIFTPFITSQGICHTFNIIDRSEFYTDIVFHFKDVFSAPVKQSGWSMENGYTPDSDMDSYPRRTPISGTKGGLNLIFNIPQDDIDYACGRSFQGFRVVLHPPDQVPRVKQKYFRLPLDHSVVVAIKPKMIATSQDLKPYEPSARQCYFNEERKLKFFGLYNQENCMLECLGNYTLEVCGCVSLHTPKQKHTPICGAAIKPCLERAKTAFTRRQESPDTKCDCLPSCNTLDYDTEISQSRWDWKSFMEIEQTVKSVKSDDGDDLTKKAHFSQLVLYYKDMQFITSQRNELYAAVDFWANCGGLLGLFTGFTVISAFEILYYLTLRLFFNIRMYGLGFWSGSEELIKAKARSD